MSEPTKAVFLSYASQDAEAAKRIADALRAAGVEVWFDAEGGLEHGDEWDAKIRRQIKECVLFLAVISANTQAREEGYFRIEWELAAQRALGIASGVAFILPVVVDGTREPEALVPDRFRTVQWTKLPGGNVPPEVLQRFLKLWSHRTGALKHAGIARESLSIDAPVADPALARKSIWSRGWLIAAIGGVAALVLATVWQPWKGTGIMTKATMPNTVPATTAESPVTSRTKAQQLIVQARALYEPWRVATADDLNLADRLLRQATELEPANADGWSSLSVLSAGMWRFHFDRTDARRGLQVSSAERAAKLDAKSAYAQLALAYRYGLDQATREDEDRTMRALAARSDVEPFVQRAALRAVADGLERPEEAIPWLERAAALPGGDPSALWDIGSANLELGRYEAAVAADDRAIALRPDFGAAYAGKLVILLLELGDLGRTRSALQQIPDRVLHDERVATLATFVWFVAGDHAKAAELLRLLPGDYLESEWLHEPKALLGGLIHDRGGRKEAAVAEWRLGLRAVEQRLAANPTDRIELGNKVKLLGLLEERTPAEETLRLLEQLGQQTVGRATASTWTIYAALGRETEVADYFEQALRSESEMGFDFLAGYFRFHPLLDPFRSHPRFVALAKVVDGIFAARANRGSPADVAHPPAASANTRSAIADKSVAVLAFANLSDDKANEYFSDGISEELLNVLAKVPQLKVAARTSSFYFKGRDEPIPEIAQKLGVAYVVEGSVRKAGNKVRITAQLIKASDGFHIWSETYDRELQDIFAVQDEIAKKILGVVKGSLLGDGELHAAAATKPEAYALYLEAQGQLARRSEASMYDAERLFKAVLALDPDYVPALVGLARTQFLLPAYSGLTGPKALALATEAKQAAEHALKLEPRNTAALTVHGSVLSMSEWRWADGEAELLRARELAPNDPWVANLTGDYFIFTGNVSAALAAKLKWTELDPLSATSHWDLGFASLLAKDYDQAIKSGERARQLSPTGINPPSVIALAAGRSGRFDLMHEALAVARRDVQENEGLHLLLEADCAILEKRPAEAHRILAQVEKLADQGEASPAYIGYLHLLLGESDLARKWLQRGYDVRDAGLTWAMNVDFAPIAADPKTRSLLELPGLKELYEIRQRNTRASQSKN